MENELRVSEVVLKDLGSTSAGVIYAFLIREYCKLLKHNSLVDGGFYCSIEDVRNKTGITEYIQRSALKILIKNGYIKVLIKGIPATRFIIINTVKMEDIYGTL